MNAHTSRSHRHPGKSSRRVDRLAYLPDIMAKAPAPKAARGTSKEAAAAQDGPVPVVVMGLGFIGQEIARAALQSEELELIGAVDSSPSIAGKKLSDVIGQPAGTFKVSASAAWLNQGKASSSQVLTTCMPSESASRI